MKNSKIHLFGMEFYAHHGCFEEERQVGTRFLVDLVLEYDATQASLYDDIDQAVNYQTVYLEIQRIMRTPMSLLETVCYNILEMLKVEFPQIQHAEVSVSKVNPALGGKVERVAVTEGY